MRSNMTTVGICFLSVALLGWVWNTAILPNAFAQNGDVPPPQSELFSQVCRGFMTSLEESAPVVNTGDRLTEIGQWVGEHEDKGLRLHNLDFEIGQKRTGFPQGWIFVCMTPNENPTQPVQPD